MKQFWKEKDGNLFQKRLSKERERVLKRSEAASSNANAKWRKNKNSDAADAYANGDAESLHSISISKSISMNKNSNSSKDDIGEKNNNLNKVGSLKAETFGERFAPDIYDGEIFAAFSVFMLVADPAVFIQGITIQFPIGLPQFPISAKGHREGQLMMIGVIAIHEDQFAFFAAKHILLRIELELSFPRIDFDFATFAKQDGNRIFQPGSEVADRVVILFDTQAERGDGPDVKFALIVENDGLQIFKHWLPFWWW